VDIGANVYSLVAKIGVAVARPRLKTIPEVRRYGPDDGAANNRWSFVMREETGTIDGDVQLASDLRLTGTIAGTAVVGPGAYLILEGTIDDDLILDLGSQVDLNGTVLGDVYNRGGNLHIAGTVLGSVYRESGYTAIGPGAEIEGDVD
jgi:cytoskeletal protein CcmA (bactofilin family)